MSADRPTATIRPLRSADYDAVCTVWRAAGLPAKLSGREARAAFDAQIEQFPTTYLGAEKDGRLIGVVLGTHDRRKGWINRLAVDPAWRRQGIALELIEACERALRAEGIEIVAALVEHGNETSCWVFERAGYLTDVPVHYFRKPDRPDI
ncbi:MAG: GNAT family N-acetyltransferase [bacterium]|nr:GNAT family N-acetyltransferase [bacterium]